MEKAEVCSKFIKEIEEAKYMAEIDHDEKGQRIVIQHEIPEGLKEEAIKSVRDYLTSGDDRYYIFSGTRDIEYFSYHIRLAGDSIVLVRNIDVGMNLHSYFNGPEEFLFGIHDMNEIKEEIENQDKNKSR